MYTVRNAFFFLLSHNPLSPFLSLSEFRGPQHCQAVYKDTALAHVTEPEISVRPVQRRQARVGIVFFSRHKSMRSKTESLQYPSDLDRGVKNVWTVWLSTLQNISSNNICHWFNAINGFFWYGTLYVGDIAPPPPPHPPSKVVKYCKLKDCQQDDAQKAKRRGRVSFDQMLVRAVPLLTHGTWKLDETYLYGWLKFSWSSHLVLNWFA